MKKIFYIILLSATTATTGCSDFLSTTPMDFTATSNFYKTAGDIETALTGCYGQMGTAFAVDYRTGLFLIGNVGTDEVGGNPYSSPDANSNMDQFQNGLVTKTNLNVRDLWKSTYSAIYSINELLDKIGAVEMDAARKEAVIAEARFLRGWNYMNLGMIFGGVPVYTAVPHDPKAGRNTLEEVMATAITDLGYAYENLDPAAAVINGRASRWAAGGYLAKLYCFLASCKLNGVGADLGFPLNSFEWVDAGELYDAADGILDDIRLNSGYKLTDDYRTLFCERSQDKQAEENLFSFAPSPQKKIGFGLMYYQLAAGTQTGGWGTCRPFEELYLRYDGARDVRLAWNLGGLGDSECQLVTIDGNQYYQPKENIQDGQFCGQKFRIEYTASKHDDAYYGYYPLLRYAEIVLLKAETAAYFDGDDAGRLILRELRSRALKPGAGLDGLQQIYRRADFIEELLDERSRELCFEQQRKFDLVRFGRYLSTVKAIRTTNTLTDIWGTWNRNAASVLVGNISANQIWMPVPNEDCLANPNLLPNNPGY